ncbi:DUF4381 family protein [Klebsiella sp. R390]|uniref:DUF4381 family protein n=1 Tax=Klebsiella sp. R390 TaxID=2755400 RepID=UPI003DAA0FD4
MTQPATLSIPATEMPALAELALPAPVSLFPDTLAWQLTFLFILMLLMAMVWIKYRRYQRQLWRRQALALAEIAQSSASAGLWFTVIKRVTLVHYTPQQLALMDDKALITQLSALSNVEQQTLTEHHYRRDDRLPEAVNHALAGAFVQWLEVLPDAR